MCRQLMSFVFTGCKDQGLQGYGVIFLFGFGLRGLQVIGYTLPETNMKTQKGPKKTTVLLKGGYMGFHVSLGECTV